MRANTLTEDFLTIASTGQVEATFVVSDPPRNSSIAFWSGVTTTQSVRDANHKKLQQLFREASSKELAIYSVNDEDEVTTVSTETVQVPLVKVLESLMPLSHQPTLSSSLAALCFVAKNALTTISEGRIFPSLTTSGIDTWRIGPLENTHRNFQAELARSLPPHLYAIKESENDEEAITSADVRVTQMFDAIADVFVRAPFSNVSTDYKAFASQEATVLDTKSALENFIKQETAQGQDLALPHLVLQLATKEDTNNYTAELFLKGRNNSQTFLSTESFWTAQHEDIRYFEQTKALIKRVLNATQRIWEPATRLAKQHLPTSIELSEQEVDQLFLLTTQRLAAVGLTVKLPQDQLFDLEITPSIRAEKEPSREQANSSLDLSSLMQLNWVGTIDGEKLSDQELNQLAETKREVIRIRGRWVKVNDGTKKTLTAKQTITTSTALAASLSSSLTIEGTDYQLETSDSLVLLRDKLKTLTSSRSRDTPAGLNASLRPYQNRGLSWLYEMDSLGLGGILADDMGLGKTIQILSMHIDRQTDRPGPTLVVCPASVIGNWEREANKFVPSINVHRYHGARRRLDSIGKNDILLTTYGVVRIDAELLNEISWGLVVADEAQGIKNPYSRTAKSLRQISAETRFALTGTPVQNKLADLWALLDWTTPGLLGPLLSFKREIAAPIEKFGDEEATEKLKKILKPFVLRRQKSDPEIAPELPPKTETDEFVPLTAEQAVLYKAVVAETMAEIKNSEGMSRKGLILRLLTRLKQVCNHPAQFLQDEEKGIADRSGKLTALLNLLSTIKASGEHSLIFTQYTQMGFMLEKYLTECGYSTMFLTGSLTLPQRDNQVKRFQKGETDTFIISLKAGGFGLNLTKATHVIHYDRWWNPAVEDQASDRAWRIGQDRPVQIHRLISEGTIEDKIATILAEKKKLSDAVVSSGESWISELNNDEIAELVSLSEDSVLLNEEVSP